MDQSDITSPPNRHRTRAYLKHLISNNFGILIKDVIVPIRVVLASFIVSAVFLIADEVILYLLNWSAKDIALRVPFVSFLLDGLQVCSTIAVGTYFLISSIANLRTQWKITRKIEERAHLI